jgi:hypothetical protein
MRVTEDMKTEGGTPLIRDADFLGMDDVGIQVTQDGEGDGAVRIVVDSTAYPNEHVYLTPDDAEECGWLVIERANESRGTEVLGPDEIRALAMTALEFDYEFDSGDMLTARQREVLAKAHRLYGNKS